MVIAHNIYAINAQRQFKINTKGKAKNNEKLSSGYKINRSADDAAGLSISEKMRNQIRGLNQGLKNVEDGIGYIKTAEGALNEIHSMLARMEELAVQSANDVNTEEDRKSIDDEIQQLKEEMGTIFDRTAFNEKKIWENNNENNINSVESIDEITEYKEKVGVKINRTYTSYKINNNNSGSVPKDGITINANNEGFMFVWNGYDGNTYASKNISWNDQVQGSYSINLNDYIDYELYPNCQGIEYSFSFEVDDKVTKSELINYVNGKKIETVATVQVGAICEDENYNTIAPFEHLFGDDAYRVLADYVNIGGCSYDLMYGVADFDKYIDENPIKFVSMDYNPIQSGDYAKSWELTIYTDKLGYISTYPKGGIVYIEGGSVYNDVFKDRESSPDTLHEMFDWVKANFPNNDAAIGLMFGTDSKSSEFMNGFGLGVKVTNATTFDDVLQKYREFSRIAFSAENTYCYLANREDTFTIKVDDNGNRNLADISENNEKMNFYIQHGANAGEDMLISYDCLSNEYLGLTDTNVLTREDSSQAINEIQKAVKKVSAQRSQFGAYQNRLEYVSTNNANYFENLQNAESNLRDTDMAKEMLEYSKNSILEQAAQSMISQANQQNQGILQLLQ